MSVFTGSFSVFWLVVCKSILWVLYGRGAGETAGRGALEPRGVAAGGDVGEAEDNGALLVAHLHTH